MFNKVSIILSLSFLFIVTGCGTQPSMEQTTISSDSKTILKNHEAVELSDEEFDEIIVHYIDVGQADSTLFELSNDTQSFHILIDSGDWNSNDVVTYLQEERISHIDILIGTHPHADHIGQMDQILELFEVSEVWMSGDETTSQTFERVLDAIIESDVDYHEPRAGEVYDIGPLVIEVLNPDELTGEVHEGSLSLLLSYGEVSFLFTGDAEHQTEQAMIDRGHHLDSTVLQLGHHGSETSTIPAFLAAVDPEIAIISAGKDNSYGHPHEEVVTRIEDAQIDLYATYIHGTIIISTDGQHYHVTTKSTEHSKERPTENIDSPTDSDITSESNCIDINFAPASELEKIIHIGTERASQLIELRPFETISDLAQINGIGPARIAEIKTENLACIGG